jgi:NADPH:quinone reductase-like Zn-dependent oxidoreductase
MRAVRFYEYGGPNVLKYETDAPDPVLLDDNVLVDMVATSVNPIDWKIRSGARQKDFPLTLPAVPGRDISGIVRAVGAKVQHYKPGDRVIGLGDATYAQQVSVQSSVLTHLPHGVDLIEAAALPLVCLTGDQLVRLATGAEAGQLILVSGALGSVGRAAVHAAKRLGAKVIAGVREKQLADALTLGADEVVAIDDDTAIAKLGPLDGVADTVGGEVAAKLLKKVRGKGRFGYASVMPADAAALNVSVLITRVFARPDPAKLREFADDLRDGKFSIPISQRLALREAANAQEAAEAGGAGKIVLVI